MSQTSRNLDVLELDTQTPAATLKQARANFQEGSAILRVDGGRQEVAEELLGIPHLGAAAGSNSQPSPFLGAAAYKDEHGAVRLVEAFGATPDTNRAPRKSPLDSWVEREQARMLAQVVDSGDPEPPAEAWTTVYRGTLVDQVQGNEAELTVGVFRLNSINSAYDYYMVATVPLTTPDYVGPCFASYCGWHLVDRQTYMLPVVTTPAAGGTVIDHGPTGTITTTTTGFDIGGSLSPDAPGVTVAFGSSWSTPSVTTVDKSDATQGEWDESITFNALPCDPTYIPDVSKGAYLSRQAAIFQVPVGTTGLTLPVKFHSHFCFFDLNQSVFGDNQEITLQSAFPLGPPVLQAYPPALTVPAGTTGRISVSASIPGSAEGFSWTVSSDSLWATVDSAGPFSVGRVVPVTIAPGQATKSQAHISINSDPKYAAPSVRTGPIEVVVTVGDAPQKTAGGVLLSGGVGIDYSPNSQVYDYSANTVFSTGPPSVGRAFHTATMLKDGRILVAGGRTGLSLLPGESPATAVAEIYDPMTLAYTAAGSLHAGRQQHTATRLPDGKVLITGGSADSGPLASAELYDPATGQFTQTGNMLAARYGHTASLESGQPAKVFIYGGATANGQPLTTTEVWDESTGTFTAGPPAPFSIQYNPQPQPLANGDLVIVGGLFDGQASAEEILLNPAQPPALTRSNAQLNHARAFDALSPLASNGELLITGGASDVASAYRQDAEVRDANAWSEVTAKMVSPRIFHTSTLLPNGKVFLAGGLYAPEMGPTNTTEFYDPASRSFSAGPTMNARYGQTATLFSTSLTTLAVNPSPSVSGQTVNLTANVETASGASSGKVEFFDGPKSLGKATLAGGQAEISTDTLGVGSYSLTAVYEGDDTSGESTSAPVTLTVMKAGSSTSLASSNNPSDYKQPVTFSSSVQVQSGTGGTATGTIVLRDGNQPLATLTLVNGATTFKTQLLTIGTHPITANYSGDSTHSASVSAVVNQVVSPGRTVTTLMSSPNSPSYRQVITFTSTVAYGTKGIQARNGALTGTVVFKDGNSSLGTVNLTNGTAVFQISLNAGQHSITATYEGSSDGSASTSPVLSIDVARASSATALLSSLNPSDAGAAVTFTANVTSSAGTPTGTVQFSNGSQPLGKPVTLANGTATVSTASLSPGAHPISVAYSGDNNFSSSASNAIQQTVHPAKTTTALSASSQSLVYGQPVTLTAAVTTGSGSTLTGDVVFHDGSGSLGHASVVNGAAQITVPLLNAGAHSISAVYPGNSQDGASTSPAVIINVSPAPTSITLNSLPNPSIYKQPIVLTAAVSSPQKGMLSGKVVFKDGAMTLGTVAVTSGSARLQESELPVGTHTLTATYEFDPNHLESTSASLQQVVNSAAVATTTTVTGHPNPATVDTSVTFQVQVRAASGSDVPDGMVVLKDGEKTLVKQNLRGGSTTFSTSSLSVGQHVIVAEYVGSTGFAASNSPGFTETINLITPEVVLVSDPNPSLVGQSVTFTVTVSSPGKPTPTGSINLSEDFPNGGKTHYGSALLINGVGVVHAAIQVPGPHYITATYGGDNQVTYKGATSTPLLQVVNKP